MSNGNSVSLEGWRKIIAMFLPVVVGAVNGIGVLPNIPLPTEYTWEALAQWAITVFISMLPTIFTLISTIVYTNANVKTKEIYAYAPKQNVPLLPAPQIQVPIGGITAGGNSVSEASVPVVVPIVPVPAPIPQIRDKIESTVKLINHETKWDFLMGIWVEKIEKAKQHLLSINPNMTQKDLAELMSKYANGVLNEDDCRNVQSVMGLPQVLHAKNDVLILQSMQAAEKAGNLGKAMSDSMLQAAIRAVKLDIVNDGIIRVQNDSDPIEDRRLALREFGLPKDVADRAMFSGGQCSINWGGSWRDFNGYQLAGVETGI